MRFLIFHNHNLDTVILSKPYNHYKSWFQYSFFFCGFVLLQGKFITVTKYLILRFSFLTVTRYLLQCSSKQNKGQPRRKLRLCQSLFCLRHTTLQTRRSEWIHASVHEAFVLSMRTRCETCKIMLCVSQSAVLCNQSGVSVSV